MDPSPSSTHPVNTPMPHHHPCPPRHNKPESRVRLYRVDKAIASGIPELPPLVVVVLQETSPLVSETRFGSLHFRIFTVCPLFVFLLLLLPFPGRRGRRGPLHGFHERFLRTPETVRLVVRVTALVVPVVVVVVRFHHGQRSFDNTK